MPTLDLYINKIVGEVDGEGEPDALVVRSRLHPVDQLEPTPGRLVIAGEEPTGRLPHDLAAYQERVAKLGRSNPCFLEERFRTLYVPAHAHHRCRVHLRVGQDPVDR